MKTWDLLDRDLRETSQNRVLQTKSKLLQESVLACVAQNCRYCSKLDKHGEIRFETTGGECTMPANSNNDVFCMSYKCCGKQYVGHRLCSGFGLILTRCACAQPRMFCMDSLIAH